MNILGFYLGKEGGGALMHVYIYIYGNTKSVFSTEPLDGCLRNMVRMNYSWSRTCV